MSGERSIAGAVSVSRMSVDGPSGGATPGGSSALKRRKSSIVDPKVVTQATARVVKVALPGEIDRRHYNVGAGLWILLCLAFVAYSLYSIAAMYLSRKNPATSFSYVDENWNFPNVAVCPMAGSWALWTLVAAGFKEPKDPKYTGISNSATTGQQNITKFVNQAGDECILIGFDNQDNNVFTVNDVNTTWQVTADVTFMTHVQLTELNTPKRVRINYVQDSAYKAYKSAKEAYDEAEKEALEKNIPFDATEPYMDDYYTEPNDYYLPYGLGYVTSEVKFLNVFEHSTKVRGSEGDGGLDAGAGSYISTLDGTSFSSFFPSDTSSDDDDATSHAEDSYHPYYSTAFDRYFYVSDTSTTSYKHTYAATSSSGKPYSSSWYGNRRWQMHGFKSGYYVKKDDNDIWKAVSYDNILTLGKQVREPLFKAKEITFPTVAAATPQYVDVRKMAFYGGGANGKPRTYRDRIVTGQEVDYLCDTTSTGFESSKSWEIPDDVYEVQFVVYYNDANRNEDLEMFFIGWDLYDYLLGPAYAFDPVQGNKSTSRTPNQNDKFADIHIDTSSPVDYWPLGQGLTLQDAFVLLACDKLGFTSGIGTSSSWLWGNLKYPGFSSATPDYCEYLYRLVQAGATPSDEASDGTSDDGDSRRLASGIGAGGFVSFNDIVNELFGGDAAAAGAAAEAVEAIVSAKLGGGLAQPQSPSFFAGDLNRHRAFSEPEPDAAGTGREAEGPGRRLATTNKVSCVRAYTPGKDVYHGDFTRTCTCNLYGGAYYLNLYDILANGWLNNRAQLKVLYRPYNTTEDFTEVDGGDFSHNNGQQRFTRQFIIGNRQDDYKKDYPCETSLDLTDATPFHLQYLSFTIQNQSPQVQYIVAIDPVDWFTMLGTIGGFWAYVAMVFGVVFVAVAGDDAPPDPVWTMRSQFGYIYDKTMAHLARLKCCFCCSGPPVASVSPAKGRDPSLSSTSFMAFTEDSKEEGASAPAMAPAFEGESKVGDSAI